MDECGEEVEDGGSVKAYPTEMKKGGKRISNGGLRRGESKSILFGVGKARGKTKVAVAKVYLSFKDSLQLLDLLAVAL